MGGQTDSIHGHDYFDEGLGEFIPPIHLSAMFVQLVEANKSDRGVDLKYSREENPTTRALEHALARLERGEDAIALNSGMAAVSAVLLGLLGSGDAVLMPMEMYGTTLGLARELGKFGVELRTAFPDTRSILDAIDGRVKLVMIESITNPTLRVLDVEEIAKAAHEVGAIVVVDNTIATPVLLNPLELGADLVVHSATKYLSGHNDVVAGAVIGDRERIVDLWHWRRRLGSILQPMEAFLVMRGLKTLELRVRRQCESAMAVAQFLRDHSKVAAVYYPGLNGGREASRLRGGFGGIVSFKVRGGRAEVERFLKSLKIIRPTPSFGGPESLITYPIVSASSAIPEDHRALLGIDDSLLRLSVGLEDVEDIIGDLDRALSAV
ncbi:cystathionine gamma-synthase [Thermocladium modestius]|uniref:Cystathionine gamma-synthase n=1 Tax=Thermocladium modestius TaxID=62609 RepID=A0A830GVL0_9CREN|nr:cystathionine gamma-synthase family protein [Thermocladium modestius]GGP22121.1 cystathionine gamma-synthase [Thermocladium modestius]